MAKSVVLMTSQIKQLSRVWQDAGAPDVTIIEGYGLSHWQPTNPKHAEVLLGMRSVGVFCAVISSDKPTVTHLSQTQ